MSSYSYLTEAQRPAEIERVRNLLDAAGIVYRIDLLLGEPPRMVFTVSPSRLSDARDVLDLDPGGELGDEVPEEEEVGPFPWSAVRLLFAVFLFHAGIVFWAHGPVAPGYALMEWGALAKGGTMMQPWRLLTSLVLHVDLPHAFWNGVSMMVFGVPLLVTLNRANTALIYLSAGVGGAVASLAFADAGTRIVGSSGAVAGLFGAWIVVTLARVRPGQLAWRSRVRTTGIALLFLPSLLSPVSSAGHPISVSSHLGGLATGMIIGILISRGLLLRLHEAIREGRRI